MRMLKGISLVAAAALVVGGVLVQAQAPVRVRATITGFDGHVLMVKTREGKDVKVNLPDNVAVNGMKALSLADIKLGAFIGTAATTGADGKLTAVEVLVFPEAARGSGEGHYPWDLLPESTMTNATVSAQVGGNNGKELSLSYKGGEKTVVVPPGVPIVTFVPADKSLLVPGAKVFFAMVVAADGSMSAARIAVAKDGVAPPM
jgi:hypothetical protein